MGFYKGKTVLITGHTGFKGSWLSKILINAGAKVIGYSLNPPTNPNLFEIAGVKDKMVSVIGDIRDFNLLKSVFVKYQPEIVLHLAAQPIVRDSYKEPLYTYETNVIGTANVLECIRLTSSVKSFLNITTDKVYLNNDDTNHYFSEEEPLDGFDPYSNSKSCSELVTHSYKKSFFADGHCAISTARAGNVIGGGDFAPDRIIPDAIRAVSQGKNILVRNPNSVRPYQHVLEPLFVYLTICQRQYEDGRFADYYNIGPDECDCVTTGQLIDIFCKSWGEGVSWYTQNISGPHEANFLRLSTSKVKQTFGWKPRWHINEAVKMIVEWTRAYLADPSKVPPIMDEQIYEYMKGGEE